ncbi:integral membrane protein, putative [Tepidicaulis marinus]|uniref:Probable membrane transporter protein n=1 Tax=Tepidicaulis marinus TaxID=1333998 RepID=A0A081BC21_9HYPH|nr:sulfite exporter TauE/SafE family protein [Tepidicaulis marinus]GAK45589.1 integral membrane protein, putative [Tepidicaulis marinus]
MQIYLPIAELSLNVFLLLGLGGAVGFLSGLFGVGGGFLMTPLLIFIGIPPAVAVATQSNQIVASSISGVLAHWKRQTVDFKMGLVLLAGGILGSVGGVYLFKYLREIGQVDLLISFSYIAFLGIIGTLMLVESVRAIQAARSGKSLPGRRPGQHSWVHGLPFKMRFRRSRLYISAIPPFLIGASVGTLVAIMGVGGGFIMVPAMIYLLKMPTNVVIGTSLFQIIFVTGLVTILHSVENQTVDVMLALLLLIGGVVGAQYGARFGANMRGEHLRALLGLLVLLVCARLGFDMVATPQDLFSLAPQGAN